MTISVSNQAYIFLFSIVGGMLIAFIYDIFRIKRKTFKTRGLAIFIEDFLFWMLVALIMFAVVYYSNEGEIRGYIFIGTVIGVILYILLFSRFVVRFFVTTINIIKQVFKTIWFIISYPFRVIFRILQVPCGLALKASRKAARKARGVGKSQLAKAAMWRRMLKNKIKKI